MPDKKCPRCDLWNTDSALRCDCGYDFETGTVKESYDKKQVINTDNEMSKEKKTDINIAFIFVSVFWTIVGIFSIIPVVTIIVFFDSPSPNWNANHFFIYSLISFPILCITSIIASIGMRFLKNKYIKLATYISLLFSLLPVISIVSIYIGFSWMHYSSCGSKFDCSTPSTPTLQEQGNARHIATCTLPVFDGEDGVTTTGCGTLEIGVIATGTISSNSEVHNWQFFVWNDVPIKITIENDSKLCPQISIFDTNGRVIENLEYSPLKCFSGISATSSFYFNPPTNGMYIIRLTAPKTPGTYWLKIE